MIEYHLQLSCQSMTHASTGFAMKSRVNRPSATHRVALKCMALLAIAAFCPGLLGSASAQETPPTRSPGASESSASSASDSSGSPDRAELEALRQEVAELKEEVQELRGKLPSQSHTMADVDYHFANLWFAGRSGNWPLATFYLNETRSHLNWAVRVVPVRRVGDGQQVELKSILGGIEQSGLGDLRGAVEKQDTAAFETAYRAMLTQCHGCHVASDKPYLEPHVPDRPASSLIGAPDP
jgi:hypothetical protein